ncbi:hypothetical protein QBC45DRAFT_414961 [Copromyces sp. CBS 386.78]|uniref:HMA domain-containing protein n=1 Tax=Pseudoneurospora amorphoporcata TaxID=241081 RepID=A0AAN6NMW9_9PEZI|nr:hypothetical protein QBC45DRAFT_414961 [Copromyces sp. CBS 386.78]KAK3948804.1 hypothetical protein QBC32DRAFT_350621 [Pseudoneurospora amorphoporcata]
MSAAEEPVTYKFNISMSCSGCYNAVNRVLTTFKAKQESVTDINVTFDDNAKAGTATVVVDPKSPLSDEDVIQTVAKPGKEITSGEKNGVVTWDKDQIKEIVAKK